jgi:hypothetical protein
MGADDTELTATSISKHNLKTVLVLLHILKFFKLVSCILWIDDSLWLWLIINTELSSSGLLQGLPGACQSPKDVHGVMVFQCKCVACSPRLVYALPYCFKSQLVIVQGGKQFFNLYTIRSRYVAISLPLSYEFSPPGLMQSFVAWSKASTLQLGHR